MVVHENLQYYLPNDRRMAMSAGQRLPERTVGTALFADLVGFTPLTEALVVAHGPHRGAEEITHLLNRVYAALIDAVDRFGGSVINFSGDAITCWFDQDSSRQAVAAGLAMQHALRELTLPPPLQHQPAALGLKVAVAAGPVRRLLVGDPAQQVVEVLAGRTVERMAAGARLAGPGEVLLAARAAHALEGQARITAWRADAGGAERFGVIGDLRTTVPPTPWPILPPHLINPIHAHRWLPPGVAARLTSGQGIYVAELRPVTALFVRFRTLDYDGEEAAGAQLDAYVRWVQGVLSRFEGSLLQLTIGDKGSYLYAVFGALLAHEDDAARAVHAAVVLRDLPADLAYMAPQQIGITAGRACAGPYGGRTSRTYGVLGDVVNLAARLMEAAGPGQVLAGAPLPVLAGPAFAWQALPQLQVKGKDTPVPVFSLIGAPSPGTKGRPATAGPFPLVGRARERARLAHLLLQLVGGVQSGGLVIIEGEAGIGKSRLVDDLAHQATAQGVRVLAGAGEAMAQATPYQAWRPVFARLLEFDGAAADPVTRRRQVLAHLPPGSRTAQLAPLLNAVLPLDLPDTELTAQMTGQVRADNTRELLLALLQAAAAQTPLLLILEDAHWLDSISWTLALAAQQQVQPLLLVIVTRPWNEELPAEYRQLLAAPGGERVRLEALPATDIGTLVCQRLGVTALPEQVAALIRERAEGHPFFSEELAYALRDTGLITIRDGRCQLAAGVTDLGTLDIPHTVEGVITGRIDRLPAPQQLTLKVASVIGRLFAFPVLHGVHPVATEATSLLDQLTELERRDLTRQATAAPDLAYLFKHVITQEVAYGLMLYAQRRALHQTVAEWFEHRYADDLAPYYPLLAYHWGRAEVPGKALDYLEKAGAQALRSGAYQEAVGFLQEAGRLDEQAALGNDRLRRARWARQLAEAHIGLGQLADAQPYARQALSLLNQPIPSNQVRLRLSLLRQVGQQLGHWLWPARRVGRDPVRQAVLLERARVFEPLSIAHYLNSEKIPALHAGVSWLNVAEAAGPSPELVRAYGSMCLGAGLVPLVGLAERYRRAGQAIAGQVDDYAARAYFSEAIALYLSGRGRWEEARAAIEQALEITDRLGDRRRWEECAGILTWMAVQQGWFGDALDLAERIYEQARRTGDLQGLSWALSGQLGTLTRQGRLEGAEPVMEALHALHVKSRGTNADLWGFGVLAVAHLRRAEYEPARQIAATISRLLAKSEPTGVVTFDADWGAAEVYTTLWEMSLAGPPAERQAWQLATGQICRELRRFARVFPIGWPLFHLYSGLAAWHSGHPRRAYKAWRQSITAAERMGLPYIQARAHYEIGRHLPAENPDRADHLTRATAIFVRLGTAQRVE